MAFHPAIARALANSNLTAEEQERLKHIHFRDAGHGFDTFGLHPSFVALGAALTGPLYDRYFRVVSKGHENIPETGAAMVAANHSGNLPIDGAMLWLDILRHTNPPRVARPVADHFVPALPWIGTLFARGGVVGGSRGNARTLLETGEIMMVFPEGVPGIVKPWSERYKLQDFRVGHAELAIRHSVPVVPVGIVGAEEQMPQLFASRRLGKPFGLPILPIPATPLPLPVRYHLLYGPPIPLNELYKPEQADDPEAVAEGALLVKDAVAALLAQGLKERQGIFR